MPKYNATNKIANKVKKDRFEKMFEKARQDQERVEDRAAKINLINEPEELREKMFKREQQDREKLKEAMRRRRSEY